MTANVSQLLRSFDELPDADKREAAAEILKRSVQMEIPPLDDSTLIQQADELFLTLDREEATREGT